VCKLQVLITVRWLKQMWELEDFESGPDGMPLHAKYVGFGADDVAYRGEKRNFSLSRADEFLQTS
jgi:hypothetical protein